VDWFAVYYVPKGDDDQTRSFYELGSSVVGYDVREPSKNLLPPASLRNLPGGFDQGWITEAQQYGFHVTIGDALSFSCSISRLETEIENLLACYKRSHAFELKRDDRYLRLETAGRGRAILRYQPNDYLFQFHALVFGRVNPYGENSYYREHSSDYTEDFERKRIGIGCSPKVLDSWAPHFTLLDPWDGKNKEGLESTFTQLFDKTEHHRLEVQSICLMIKRHGENHYRIHREFPR
jgi:hypothetical protein